VHSPGAKFVLPGSGVAGDTRGIFLALAGMKAGADQLEVGDRRELESVQIRGVLGSPFRGSEPRSPNFRGYPALKPVDIGSRLERFEGFWIADEVQRQRLSQSLHTHEGIMMIGCLRKLLGHRGISPSLS